jgi:hypothetical protein
MSWSVTFIGKPENVSKALKENSEKLSGYSKDEYDAVLPDMDALVSQNFNVTPEHCPLVKITASGHGSKDTYGYFVCSIETMSGVLV